MTLTAHFLDEKGELKAKMLSCESFHMRETGENLLERIEDVLKNFGIVQEKLVAAIRDNASNVVKSLRIMGRIGNEWHFFYSVIHIGQRS